MPAKPAAQPKDKPQHFRAFLEKGDKALGWTIARVPFDPREVWTEVIRLRVQGEVNGHPFRTSLFPDPRGGFYLLINRATQSGAHIFLGDEADFQLAPDLAPRQAELPEELAVLLEDEPGLRDWYDSCTEYARREMGKWILGVKSDEAKVRRAQQMAERLLSAMEGEHELPPVIAAAFRARPRAKAGWARMTDNQRRNELLAVFYYQTPESREKRVQKLCDLAEKHQG